MSAWGKHVFVVSDCNLRGKSDNGLILYQEEKMLKYSLLA
jgi:hypothetical protein